MKIFGLAICGLAVGVFYMIFFKLAPYIISALPKTGEWSKFIEIVVYIIVGYLGGIGIPLVILFLGITVFVEGLD